jgi:hypothetical protein
MFYPHEAHILSLFDVTVLYLIDFEKYKFRLYYYVYFIHISSINFYSVKNMVRKENW